MSIRHVDQSLPFVFSWRDISLMTIILVILNLIDVVSSFYAVNSLGFVELNHLATSFPVLVFLLKFGVCFVPMTCAYVLRKTGMENCLLMPFAFLAVLIGFYAFVVGSNLHSIIGL